MGVFFVGWIVGALGVVGVEERHGGVEERHGEMEELHGGLDGLVDGVDAEGVWKCIRSYIKLKKNYSLLKFLITIASNSLMDSPSNCTRCGLFRRQMMQAVMHILPRIPVDTPIPYIHGFTKQINKMKSTIVLNFHITVWR